MTKENLKEIRKFIEGLEDEKLKEFLTRKYFNNESERKKDVCSEIFNLSNSINENRMNSVYRKREKKEWAKRNGM